MLYAQSTSGVISGQGYEGVRWVERGYYKGPPAEPVPRCFRPPPDFGGQRRLKEAIMRGPRPQCYRFFFEPDRLVGTGPGESTSRSVPQVCSPEPDSGDAEDPLVTQGMTRPASQAQGERQARKRDWTESVRETLLE